MPLPVKDVLDIVAENIRKTGMPVQIPKETVFKWAEGLGMQKGSETVLFTGALYQLTPFITSVVEKLESVEKSKMASVLMKVTKEMGSLTKLIVRPPKEEMEKQYEVLTRIVMLLRRSGNDVGYLYDDDMYSGVLLYDMGLDDEFQEHAKKVFRRFRELGVKNLITVDPHTTHVMRDVYKEFLPNYDLTVKNYLEVLATSEMSPTNTLSEKITIHDPCLYARYSKIIEQPRKLLRDGGINIVEPDRTKELTFCCGGPIESIAPSLAKQISRMRMDELCSKCNNILVMCPICYTNLSRVKPDGVTVEDVSSYLYSIYGGKK